MWHTSFWSVCQTVHIYFSHLGDVPKPKRALDEGQRKLLLLIELKYEQRCCECIQNWFTLHLRLISSVYSWCFMRFVAFSPLFCVYFVNGCSSNDCSLHYFSLSNEWIVKRITFITLRGLFKWAYDLKPQSYIISPCFKESVLFFYFYVFDTPLISKAWSYRNGSKTHPFL